MKVPKESVSEVRAQTNSAVGNIRRHRPYRRRNGKSRGINILRLYDDSESTRLLDDLEKDVIDLSAETTAVHGPFSAFKASIASIANDPLDLRLSHDNPSHGLDAFSSTIDWTTDREKQGAPGNTLQSLALNDTTPTLTIITPSQPFTIPFVIPEASKPRVSELLSHYLDQVADVIQVIGHPNNMFRSVYAQYAIQISAQSAGLPQVTLSSHKAIFCAIVSTAAFHLRGLNSLDKARWALYNQIGMGYRLRALQYMRQAMMEPFVDAETHCAKMSAILTLVDLDVMEGSSTDFFAHLRGCHQARRLRIEHSLDVDDTQPRVRQLEINSIFMDTIALTTANNRAGRWHFGKYSDQPTLLDTPFSSTDTFLEHTYGVTASIASMIYATNKIWLYTSGRTKIMKLSSDVVNESLAMLAAQLEMWSPSTEIYASVARDDAYNVSLLESLSTSFYYAARIYFHSCFRFHDGRQDSMPARLSDLTLMAYEQSEVARLPATKAGAPLSWPAFVAACEAPPHLRTRWTRFWQSLLKHGLGTQQAAWQVVQEVWKTEDIAHEVGNQADMDEKRVLARFESFEVIEPKWARVVRDSGATIFAW